MILLVLHNPAGIMEVASKKQLYCQKSADPWRVLTKEESYPWPSSCHKEKHLLWTSYVGTRYTFCKSVNLGMGKKMKAKVSGITSHDEKTDKKGVWAGTVWSLKCFSGV